MKPLAVHHVALNVNDLDEALDFYIQTMGFVRRTDRPDLGFPGAWLDVGTNGQQVHLLEATVPTATGQHFAVLVDDLAATIDQLRADGVAVSDLIPIGTGAQAFTLDPSGNQIELHQTGFASTPAAQVSAVSSINHARDAGSGGTAPGDA